MKKILMVLLVFFIAGNANGTRILYGSNVVITRPVYEDLYIAAGSVTINAPVYGDLIVAGGQVFLNDLIRNDVLVAGGQIHINGDVGDDVRCAGGEVNIQKNIGGDLIVTGGKVTVEKPATVMGSLFSSSGEVIVDGTINGDAKTAAGTFILNGLVAGAVESRSSTINVNGQVNGPAVLAANTLNVGDHAAFSNNVRYYNGKGKIDFGTSLKGVTATYDSALRVESAKWYFLGSTSVYGLLWFLTVILAVIMTIEHFFKNTFSKASDTVFTSTLKSLGTGVLFFLSVPVAIVVTFVTIIGIPISVLLLILYAMVIMLAITITSVVTAHWFNNRLNYKWNYWRLVGASFGVFILIKLFSLVTLYGPPIAIILVLLAFGSIILNINPKAGRIRSQGTLKTAA
jgi:hypothetical protein